MSIVFFDLDGTCIDSAHRTPLLPSGKLNLPEYKRLQTRENIFRDNPLPLLAQMKRLIGSQHFVGIITAREMTAADYDYLRHHGIFPDVILSRDVAPDHFRTLPDGEYKRQWIYQYFGKITPQLKSRGVILFDDNPEIKAQLRDLIHVVCAHKTNARIVK